MKISVIVCTHNPRADHLGRALDALRRQSLSLAQWELVIVDNASAPALDGQGLAAWHPSARVVTEATRGLIPARLRGIGEATGDLLVFVDDDNVLAPDFLTLASGIAAKYPDVGAFGGQIHPEFEIPPSAWFAARLDRLAIREFSMAEQTQQLDPAIAPCGAGLCVRSAVAERYRANTLNDSRRLALGRDGKRIFSGDDLDLAFTACDLGLAIGRFPELGLDHLIPPERLTLRYFACITRSHARSHFDLRALRPGMIGSAGENWRARLAYWKWSVIAGFFAVVPDRRRPR